MAWPIRLPAPVTKATGVLLRRCACCDSGNDCPWALLSWPGSGLATAVLWAGLKGELAEACILRSRAWIWSVGRAV